MLTLRLSLTLLFACAALPVWSGTDPLRLPAKLPDLDPRGAWQVTLDELEPLGTLPAWTLIGPIVDKDFKQFDLKDGLEPDRKDDWTGQNTRPWQRKRNEEGCYVDLTEALDDANEVLAYARAEVEAPLDGAALIWFECYGRAVVYLNNQKISAGPSRNREREPSRGQLYPIAVQLKKGLNVLKVKLGQERKPKFKGFGFYCYVERNDAAWKKALQEKLCALYPQEAAGWRGAEGWLDVARQFEREGQSDAAAQTYKKVADTFGTHLNEDWRLEADAGLQRLKEKKAESSEALWNNWKKIDAQFKALLKSGETLAADRLMRDYIARNALHESAGNALVFRAGLRHDYNRALESLPFYERALRDHGQNEFVRLFSHRGLASARRTRLAAPTMPVRQEFQMAVDGARRQISGGDEHDIAAGIKSLLEMLGSNAHEPVVISDSPHFPRYVGLREYMHALLTGLGGRRLSIYRQQVERESTARLSAAQRLGTDVALGAVAWEFPNTLAAATALNQLANRHLDRGETAAAEGLLTMLQTHYQKVSPVSPALILAKLARAQQLNGKTDAARKTLERLEKDFAAERAVFAGEELSGADLARKLTAGRAKDAAATLEFATYAANPQRTGATPPQAPVTIGAIQWSVPQPQVRSASFAKENWPEDTFYAHLQCYPVVVDDRAVVTSLDSIQVLKLADGKAAWQQQWDSQGSLLPKVDGRALFTGYPVSCPTVDRGQIYMRALNQGRSALRCYRFQNGELLWSTEPNKALERMVWLSDPLIAAGLAIAVYLEPAPTDTLGAFSLNNTHGVAALDAQTGALRWKRPLTTGAMGRVVEGMGHDSKRFATYRTSMQLGPPAVEGATVYTSTGLGSLAALNLFNGELIWLSGYPQLNSESLENGSSAIDKFMPRVLKFVSRGASSPMVCDDVVILAPKDAPGVLAFERSNGQIRWQQELLDARFIAGVCGGNVLLVDNQICALSVQTGRVAWEIPAAAEPKKALYSAPALAGNVLYAPFGDRLQQIDALTGKLLGSVNWDPKTGPFGNLVVGAWGMLGLNGKQIVKLLGK